MVLTTLLKHDILSLQHNSIEGCEHMTQNKEKVERLAELNSLFLSLDDKGQDSALIILRSLDFAQSVMCSSKQSDKHIKKCSVIDKSS